MADSQGSIARLGARWLVLGMSGILLVAGLACGDGSDGGSAGTSTPLASALREDGTAILRLVAVDGHAVSLEAEIADEPAETSKGLSARESLAAEWGMLFVLQRRSAGFWMKDTRIPLSVAFIAGCGEIVHIAHMEPLSLQIHNSPREYAFGLEVNRGWFEGKGIAVGDRVELPPEMRPGSCAAAPG